MAHRGAAHAQQYHVLSLILMPNFDYQILGNIDFGDRCWRRNELMTILRCWSRVWAFWSPTSTIFPLQRRSQTLKRCHQH